MHYHCENSYKKSRHSEQHTWSKRKCNINSGWFRTIAGKVRKNLNIQEQQSNQSHCYNQNMGFVNKMDQNVAKG